MVHYAQSTKNGARVGHLRYWNSKIKEYNIAVKEKDSDQLVQVAVVDEEF
jgi:hypothetical protein